MNIKKGITTTEILVVACLYAKSYLEGKAVTVPDLDGLDGSIDQVAVLMQQLQSVAGDGSGNLIYWIGGIYIIGRVIEKVTSHFTAAKVEEVKSLAKVAEATNAKEK